MNTTLTALRQAMTDFLAGEGIPALTAWPREPREEGTTPVAVVQIQEVRASGGGFQNYLGQTYDPASKTWTETYGQQVGVTFALTLYSPGRAGGGWVPGAGRPGGGGLPRRGDRRGLPWRSGPWGRPPLMPSGGCFG